MSMKLSTLFGKSIRQVAETDTVSHELLLRGGFVDQLAAGVYSYLPLGQRTLRKIEQIVREEMDAAGAQEILMPAIQPLEIWEQSGRADTYGPVLFRLTDRRDRAMVLGPTHEEVVTGLARQQIRSYRDLPATVFQIQTKFRDEPRPRGGIVRGREFIMKDAYSFDADEAGLDQSYDAMFRAYERIFKRCGLPTLAVQADSGAIGGKDSVEFILIAESGEDSVLFSEASGYAANRERAESIKPPGPDEPERPMEPVATPGITSIEQVAKFLNVPATQTLKAVFYEIDGELVFVVIRGDQEVNEVKLRNVMGGSELKLADDALLRKHGIVAGSASPVGTDGVTVIADKTVEMGSNFVAGGNEPGVHLRNVNFPRDFSARQIVDIATAREGDGDIVSGEPLKEVRGIEVGHVFKLGTGYSEKLDARFVDADGQSRPVVMGCYGIGVSRIMAAAVEQNHDDKGIIWPASIAPFDVHLVALSLDNIEVEAVATELYEWLRGSGFDVLYDDRLESPGVKFNDADLIGIPVRLTVSPRLLPDDLVEVKLRTSKEMEKAPRKEIGAKLGQLFSELRGPAAAI